MKNVNKCNNVSMPDSPNNLELLLLEVDDVLRSMPPKETLRHPIGENFAWLGRAAAVIAQWSLPQSVSFEIALHKFNEGFAPTSALGYRKIMILLHKAQNDLRMKTAGPLTLAIDKGRVFEYFDELRKIIEQASEEVYFVDAYLDAEFVSRYLRCIRNGITIRLLMGTDPLKLKKLLPAVDLFVQETGQSVNVRSSIGLHDRYVFIDESSCYFSGASFKDGGRKAGTVISQIADAFKPMWETYETLWAGARVER